MGNQLPQSRLWERDTIERYNTRFPDNPYRTQAASDFLKVLAKMHGGTIPASLLGKPPEGPPPPTHGASNGSGGSSSSSSSNADGGATPSVTPR